MSNPTLGYAERECISVNSFSPEKKLLQKLLSKKRLWHRSFLVNFAKFLRTPFLIEHLRWLPLSLVISLLVLSLLVITPRLKSLTWHSPVQVQTHPSHVQYHESKSHKPRKYYHSIFFLIHGIINILGITSYYKSKTIYNVREILADDGYLSINFVVIKQYFPEDDVMTTS